MITWFDILSFFRCFDNLLCFWFILFFFVSKQYGSVLFFVLSLYRSFFIDQFFQRCLHIQWRSISLMWIYMTCLSQNIAQFFSTICRIGKRNAYISFLLCLIHVIRLNIYSCWWIKRQSAIIR